MNNKFVLVVAVILILLAGFYFAGFQKNRNKTNSGTATSTPKSSDNLNLPKNMTGVIVTGSGFEPTEIKIKAKTIVTWVNKSGGPVTVNSDNHPAHLLYPFLNLGEFASGSSVQAMFDKPGKYTYHNHLNPEQKGTVIVE